MRYTRLIELSTAVTAVILNLLLIPIIITKSSQKLGRYKYLLLAYTFSACYYAFAIATMLFTWYYPENGFLFISTVNIYPRWVQQVQAVLFCGCYITTMFIIDLSFIYRLSIIDGSNKRTAKLRYTAMSILGIVFVVAVIGIGAVFVGPLPETDTVFREEVLSALDIEVGQMGYIGGQLIIDHHVNTGIVTIICVVGTFVSISFVVSTICWYKIGAQLALLQNIPDSSYRLHRKCYLLLTLQTCSPIMFNMIPVGIVIAQYLLGMSSSLFPNYCAMVLSIAQIMDPLFTVFFIAEYKSFILRSVKKFFNGNMIGFYNSNRVQSSTSNQLENTNRTQSGTGNQTFT